MCRHPLLRSWLLLVPLLVAACGLPDTTTPPPAATATPLPIALAPATAALAVATPLLAAPVTAALAVATPTPTPLLAAPATTALTSSTSISPHAQFDPTQEAYCQQPGYSDTPECLARVIELPPTPAVAFDQALGQFSGRSLLFTRLPSLLMLGDPDSGASLWLNRAFCPPRSTRDISGQWSADGQFVAFICQDNRYKATLYLLDMQTADGRQIAQGGAVNFAWSPEGHRLLVAEQTTTQRAILLDAASGATTALPVAPLWENHGYPAPIVGPAASPGRWFIDDNHAAMAWSPDGARIAVIAEQSYVLDADAAHARDGKLALLTTIAGSSIRRPWWSHDGRFVYTVVPHQNHNDPHHPSSMYGAKTIRIEISSGTVEDVARDDSTTVWSPDGRMYVTNASKEALSIGWSLYQADGTLIRMLTSDPPAYFPVWTPDSRQILMTTLGVGINRIIAFDLAGHERVIVASSDTLSYFQAIGSPISQDSALLAVTVKLSNVLSSERSRIAVYDLEGGQRAMFEGGGVMGWRAGH